MSVRRNILIICHANTSRSVIAEALLIKLLAERGLGHVTVQSGGIAAYARDGALVSMDARLVLREHDIHISPESVSTDLKNKPHLVDDADLILAMTGEQVEMLRRVFPQTDGKEVHTLKSFAGDSGDIEDPAGRGDDVYAACRDEILTTLEKVVDRLALSWPGAERGKR